jgi:hypothetical protein
MQSECSHTRTHANMPATHAHSYQHAHTLTHAYAHTYACTCSRTLSHICIHTHTYACTRTHALTHLASAGLTLIHTYTQLQARCIYACSHITACLLHLRAHTPVKHASFVFTHSSPSHSRTELGNALHSCSHSRSELGKALQDASIYEKVKLDTGDGAFELTSHSYPSPHNTHFSQLPQSS